VIDPDKPGAYLLGITRIIYLSAAIQSNYTHLFKDVTSHVATSPIKIA
jgi:hypothetical protein